MQGGIHQRGYTIVEVLIFMAVSGVMFVMAIIFVSGKQSAVEFRQGLYDTNSEIQTAINDVANGRVDSLTFGSTTKCEAPATGGPPVISNTIISSNKQGANGGKLGCVFLGKVLQFKVSEFGSESAFYFANFSLAGRQVNSAGSAVTSFSEANPTVIFPIAGRSNKDLTVTKRFQSSLESTAAYLCSGTGCVTRTSIGAVGFFGSFNPALGSATGAAQSGSQTVTTAVIPGSVYGASRSSTAGLINANTRNITGTNIVSDGKYVLLCFQNNTKKGYITIGGINGQQFTTQVKTGSPIPVVPSC